MAGHHIGKGIQKGKHDNVGRERVEEIQELKTDLSVQEIIELSQPIEGKNNKRQKVNKYSRSVESAG